MSAHLNTRVSTNLPTGLPTPLHTALAAGFEAYGPQLPIPFLELTALIVRDLPLENVAALQRFITDAKSDLATLTNMVQAGLELRYGEQAKAQLLTEGKDTGTTHILDAGYDIGVEIAKETKYEPKGLTELVAKIKANGGDPSEYVEVKYSVLESKFKAWPKTIRAPFEALRTVKPKAPKFVLRRVGANGEGK